MTLATPLLSVLVLLAIVAGVSCGGGPEGPEDESELAAARELMVATQIEARGVRAPRVLAAMRRMPRHRFVPAPLREAAYDDIPLPIGLGQTISQPYIVAVMTEALAPEPGDVVLEVGTGSGYQAAVLAQLVKRVYTIELLAPLAERARAVLAGEGITNVEVEVGDGWKGLPAHAPYDGILVTAAPDVVPQALLDQLAIGGRLIVPVGEEEQELRLITRTERGFETRTAFEVRFVPLVHEVE